MWRTGSRVPLNVYKGDVPICQCHTPEDAIDIVTGMNAVAVLKARVSELEIGRKTMQCCDPVIDSQLGQLLDENKKLRDGE